MHVQCLQVCVRAHACVFTEKNAATGPSEVASLFETRCDTHIHTQIISRCESKGSKQDKTERGRQKERERELEDGEIIGAPVYAGKDTEPCS